MRDLAEKISIDGHTFCPATFKNSRRNKENFEQQQFFALDFDNKDPGRKVSLGEIKERAGRYDLPVLFAYDTYSSKKHDKFRVVFLNDVSIYHRKVAEAIQLALGTIFPEADSSCYKDVSKYILEVNNVGTLIVQFLRSIWHYYHYSPIASEYGYGIRTRSFI